jgi:hypothetical protein
VSNLPEPVRHPSVVRAAVSPTAVVVTAAGVVVGLVLLHSIILAIVLGAGAWAGRMIAAMIAQARRERAARPKPAVLDPWSVPEPWRQLVTQAQGVQNRFDQTIKDWPPGPIRDRLVDLRPRFYADMDQVGAIARRGASLSGWSGGVQATGRPSTAQLSEQLRQAEAERRQVASQSPAREAALARTEEAVAAQLRALRGAEEAAALVQDRLRSLVARLDQTVTSMMVLGVDGSEAGTQELESSIDGLADEITALHRGLTDATSSSSTSSPPPPPPSLPAAEVDAPALAPPPAPPAEAPPGPPRP